MRLLLCTCLPEVVAPLGGKEVLFGAWCDGGALHTVVVCEQCVSSQRVGAAAVSREAQDQVATGHTRGKVVIKIAD
jgi:hypothetical protein